MEEQWMSGEVVRGLQNGRLWGFPTINIALDNPDLLKDTGVFSTKILLRNKRYKGMLYVGTRPTLDLLTKTVEINIFDFHEDCYGERVQFTVGKKIRSEKKFASLEELINQLKRDKNEISKLFGN